MQHGLEAVVEGANLCFAVLGSRGDFVLVDLTTGNALDPQISQEARARGWGYCGVLGVKNGIAAAHCEPDEDSQRTMLAAALFAAPLITDRVRQTARDLAQDDSAGWLESLHKLADDRSGVNHA